MKKSKKLSNLQFLLCLSLVLLGINACTRYKQSSTDQEDKFIQKEKIESKRFFSDESFWNQPITENPEIDPQSDKWIAYLELEPTVDHFDFNNKLWTIPVYEVDSLTPSYTIQKIKLSQKEKDYRLSKRDYYGFGKGFGSNVPIPDHATPDPEQDAHFAVVDRQRNLAWDMWGLKKKADGNWESFTGMQYKLDGDGTFSITDYSGIINDESVHFHGPSRAAGVPTIAGLIMYDEIKSGEIKHKLSFASRFAGYKEFVYPASWTDGLYEEGIPEGAVLQLDPDLDLSKFDLLPGEFIVAKALQKYGMVLVDVASGQSIYAEGLWARAGASWDGILGIQEDGLKSIKFKHYRVLKVNNVVKGKGDASKDRGNMRAQVDWPLE